MLHIPFFLKNPNEEYICQMAQKGLNLVKTWSCYMRKCYKFDGDLEKTLEKSVKNEGNKSFGR